MGESTSIAAQANTLLSLPTLAKLPRAEARIIAEMAVFRAFAPRTSVVLAGSSGDHCYIVLEGTLISLTQDQDGREIELGVLEAGDSFGGGALFGSRLRLTTVRATTRCYTLQLSMSTLREKQHYLPAFNAILEQHYRQRRVISTLSRVPLFSQLPLSERQTLVAHLDRRVFERNTTIFEQDTPGHALFLIEQGQLAIEQDGQVIASLAEGDFFGEMALLTGAPHNATVRTLTPVRCLELPGTAFQQLVREHPSLEAALRHLLDERMRHNARMRHDQPGRERLTLAVEWGMLRGTHLLVRTPSECPPGCRLCEQGCATRFGQTRIHLNGVRLGEMDITLSCRQCRVGAECVEACPEDALHWDERGALRVTSACTGCADCVPACPYQAMELKPMQLAEQGGPLWMLWRRMRGEDLSQPPAKIASKCDLCSGYTDRACMSVCPTGSLQLIPIEEVFPL